MATEKPGDDAEDVASDDIDEASDDVVDEDELVADDDVEDALDEYPSEPAPLTAAAPARKTGGGIAWLALIAAVGALGLAGFDLWRSQGDSDATAETDAALADVRAELRATRSSVDTLSRQLSEQADLGRSAGGDIENLERDLDNRLQEIEALQGRLSALEAAVSSLQGISAGARDAWLLAEAEYYMQIANAQLQLARNPELARLALTLADERIQQLGDPRLTDVRRALSGELRALDVIAAPDIAGISLTLASLADVVDALPLEREVVAQANGRETVDPDLSGMDRAMATLRNAVSGVVSVRRTDENVEPLIAPEAQYFLRANLALKLQAARLALLRGEQTIFEQSLDEAADWLRAYYDTDSNAVSSALESIEEIRGSVLSIEIPDISRSLRLLRQYNALAEAQRNERPVPPPPPREPQPEPQANETDDAAPDAEADAPADDGEQPVDTETPQ